MAEGKRTRVKPKVGEAFCNQLFFEWVLVLVGLLQSLGFGHGACGSWKAAGRWELAAASRFGYLEAHSVSERKNTGDPFPGESPRNHMEGSQEWGEELRAVPAHTEGCKGRGCPGAAGGWVCSQAPIQVCAHLSQKSRRSGARPERISTL